MASTITVTVAITTTTTKTNKVADNSNLLRYKWKNMNIQLYEIMASYARFRRIQCATFHYADVILLSNRSVREKGIFQEINRKIYLKYNTAGAFCIERVTKKHTHTHSS